MSVVIPCFNGAKYLRPCLESALAQHDPGPAEVLVGDDGSTDDSARIAESNGPRVRVLHHPGRANRGLPATRNLCIREARYPLIAFLDADDVWLPGHLNALVGALADNPLTALAYGNGRYLDDDGRLYGRRLPPGHTVPTPEALLVDNCLTVNGMLIRKVVFTHVGLFDESLRYSEDHDMWLRIFEKYPVVYAPVFGYAYRQHAGQMSRHSDLIWQFAQRVVNKARARYPYRRSVLRRRMAVLAYRRGECAWRGRDYMRGAAHLGRALLLDPGRAVREAYRRIAVRWGITRSLSPAPDR